MFSFILNVLGLTWRLNPGIPPNLLGLFESLYFDEPKPALLSIKDGGEKFVLLPSLLFSEYYWEILFLLRLARASCKSELWSLVHSLLNWLSRMERILTEFTSSLSKNAWRDRSFSEQSCLNATILKQDASVASLIFDCIVAVSSEKLFKH